MPDETDRTWTHARYTDQLLKGDFRDATRDEFVALVARVRNAQGIDAVILGGTELPLLLRDEQVAGLPVLDTTELHVRAIVKRLRT
jgi:aspartate racemase